MGVVDDGSLGVVVTVAVAARCPLVGRVKGDSTRN